LVEYFGKAFWLTLFSNQALRISGRFIDNMISNKFNLDDFFNAIEEKPGEETLLIAHQEATEVERWLIKHRKEKTTDVQSQGDLYLIALKQFIVFFRSSIGIPKTSQPVSKLYAKYVRSQTRLV
jgi:hypothetical protein